MSRVLLWCGIVTTCLALAAGFALERGRLHQAVDLPTPRRAAVTDEQRAEALRLIDRAVSARHEERLQGAVNAISEARRLNPDAPGLDVFVGEVAWERRDAETVRRAAREALARGHDESSAKLLLALEKWMTRLGGGTAQVGSSVRQLLAEAEEESPSSAAPFFFHGEVSRMLGDSAEAHHKLLGALHRQMPWTSAALLEIKLQFAAAESVELGRFTTAPMPSAAASAALRLRNERVAGQDWREILAQLLAASPAIQTNVLFSDPALRASDLFLSPQRIPEKVVPFMPNGDVNPVGLF